jgi:hypothetical protein
VDQGGADRSSLKSFETYESATSGKSTSKLKNLGARIRRRPLPRYLKGSIRRHAAADIEPARVGRGMWRDQLLSDRSFRGMAALMTLFAIGMITVVCSYAKEFGSRANRNTTSVGGATQSCKSVTHTNTALLLLINVCATMVLGMSNTYQQLVTSLKVSDLKHVLSKYGDSRVGTNSPFSINHKRDGKKRAWASWFLLICTSMPVHFLANSLIGPTYTQELPSIIEYNAVDKLPPTSYSSLQYYYTTSDVSITSQMSFPCWSAFRTGTAHYAKAAYVLDLDQSVFGFSQSKFGTTWKTMVVNYQTVNCTKYMNNAHNIDMDTLERSHRGRQSSSQYQIDNCAMGKDVFCSLRDPETAKCRLNIRMSAAFTLMICLVLKAGYMITVNLLARGKLKQHCLTFGDVLIASASHPEIRVQGLVSCQSILRQRAHGDQRMHGQCWRQLPSLLYAYVP